MCTSLTVYLKKRKKRLNEFLFVCFIFCFTTKNKNKKQSQQYFLHHLIKKNKTNKKLLQLNTKWNIPKLPNATQKERNKNRQEYKIKYLEVYNYKKKLEKHYLKRRQVSTTKCATLPQSACTSFLEYKVMQILYNKLTQAHLPMTTAKQSNVSHGNTLFFLLFCFVFGNSFNTSHREINLRLLGSNVFVLCYFLVFLFFFWFLENICCVHNITHCLYEFQRLTNCILCIQII